MGTIICRHDRLRRQCDECDMSEEIAQLRAEIARVTAERDREAHDRQTAGDAWNDMRRQRDAALVERDAARADLARMTRALADERAAVAIAHERMDALTAERDARPEISREDAAGFISVTMGARLPSTTDLVGAQNVRNALRAHAAGSGAAEASDGPFGPVSDWLSKVPSIKRESLGTWRANDCAACEGSGYANARTAVAGARTCPACNGTGRKEGRDA